MASHSEANKKILKNALFLYTRMFLMMAVSLYTSRVILRTLGVEDFGIYNVVAGVVVLFAFINTAMQSASQRYITFALGRRDSKEITKVFSMSLTAHLFIAVVVFCISETIGLFFLNKMNFPEARMGAIQWVYQFAICTCLVQIVRVPYNASIIAYERMSFYAWISLIEAFLKLGIVFLLNVISGDKLISYSILLFTVTCVITFLYKVFCTHNFSDIRYKFFWENGLFKQYLSFTSWSLFGSFASVSASQGLNFILNIFCGVIVNAAVGIGNQVMGAITQFLGSFQTAFNPQLVKLYAKGEQDNFMDLLLKASRFSYFLMLILSVPIILNCDFLLHIWLGTVPDYAVSFSQVMIIGVLFESISGPLWISVQATGKIKTYQILMSVLLLANLPIAIVIMYSGFSPVYVFGVKSLMCLVALLVRVWYLNKLISLSIRRFFKEVLLVLMLVTLLIIPIPYVLCQLLEVTWESVILETLICVAISFIVIYLIGLTKGEKKYVREFIIMKYQKILNK